MLVSVSRDAVLRSREGGGEVLGPASSVHAGLARGGAPCSETTRGFCIGAVAMVLRGWRWSAVLFPWSLLLG